MAPGSEKETEAIIDVSENGIPLIRINITEDELTKGEFIDLGLPSGTKWASCNLGATLPCEYGDYYMWGSVEPNTNTPCNWADAPFNNGSSSYDEAYFNSVKDTVCPNGILAPEYDAAKKVLGGKAHIPTYAQIEELLSGTTLVWCNCTYLGADHKTHNIYGHKLTSKTNGNSIFIPAAGSRFDSRVTNQGVLTFCWSSSHKTEDIWRAWSLMIYYNEGMFSNSVHCMGLSIRPVKDKEV